MEDKEKPHSYSHNMGVFASYTNRGNIDLIQLNRENRDYSTYSYNRGARHQHIHTDTTEKTEII